MEKNEFLLSPDERLELGLATLSGTETLQSLEGWNSLASITFIAPVNERFGISLRAIQVFECSTIEDLMRLVGGRTEQEVRT